MNHPGWLDERPMPRPRRWVELVNEPQTDAELNALRRCVVRGQPFGSTEWIEQSARPLGLTFPTEVKVVGTFHVPFTEFHCESRYRGRHTECAYYFCRKRPAWNPPSVHAVARGDSLSPFSSSRQLAMQGCVVGRRLVLTTRTKDGKPASGDFVSVWKR